MQQCCCVLQRDGQCPSRLCLCVGRKIARFWLRAMTCYVALGLPRAVFDQALASHAVPAAGLAAFMDGTGCQNVCMCVCEWGELVCWQ